MGLPKLPLLAPAAFALCACGSFKDQAISQAEHAVQAQLKDPSSASFDGVFLVYGDAIPDPTLKDARHVYTCGYVNSRNSYGAMAGKTRFVVAQIASRFQGKMSATVADTGIEDPLTDVHAGDQSSFEMIYWSNCRGQQVPEDG